MVTRAAARSEAALTLTWNQVRAWRLRRQHLLQRTPDAQLTEVVSGAGGIQAQVMSAAELAIWARVEGVRQADIRRAIWEERRLVKTWSMRGTLHLLRAGDLPLYVAAWRSYRPELRGAWLRAFGISEVELRALLDAIPQALDGRCLTREQLAGEVGRITGMDHWRQRLRSGWGEFLKPAARRGHLCFGPSQGQNVTFVRPDQWLGSAVDWQEATRLDDDAALQEVMRRFLHTYGPATADDFARWWGIPSGTGRHMRALATAGVVRPVAVEGLQLWALTEDLDHLRDTVAPASPPVRLLPNFDTFVLGYRPREQLVAGDLAPRIFRTAGWISPVLLLEGTVAGVWEVRQRGRNGQVEVQLESFRALDGAHKAQIEAEAAGLGAFLGGQASVTFQDAPPAP
ncbi:MAG TPA: winged helix DNA-binding domain-containing protein [Chloroflexota bacterium]|nr:winged helix DNA-binding domain-containing protein [Chloroflexota bacterium]